MRSTARVTLRRAQRHGPLADAPGEAHIVRDELGGDAEALLAPARTVLARLLHLTDTHVMDAASPARAEWVEAYADDPRWQPLLHMHRPYEALANAGLAAMAGSVARWAGDPIELAVVTGDCIDNAQANELEAYLALLDGGSHTLPYAGPLEAAWRDALEPTWRTAGGGRGDGDLWPFWVPEDERGDVWKDRYGFPTVEGLLAAVSEPLASPGIAVPWIGVLGNHDVLRQGTAWSTPALEAIAVGPWKHAAPADVLLPDPLGDYLVRPEDFSRGLPRFAVQPDPGRRAITSDDFIRAHRERGHGFPAGAITALGDYVIDTASSVRLIVIDTNHPGGNFDGSIGDEQLAWVDAQLIDAAERPCVVVSHHGRASLGNTQGGRRRQAADLEAVLHRHGNVVAWLSGHRHRHRVRPCPDPTGRTAGFWELTTGSIIDWPCQGRIVEVVAGADGRIGVVSTIVDHDAPDWRARSDGWLGGLHRELAERFSRSEAGAERSGGLGDRNVVLPRG
jgi:metallophosphoesterase (TIGR03767 family)